MATCEEVSKFSGPIVRSPSLACLWVCPLLPSPSLTSPSLLLFPRIDRVIDSLRRTTNYSSFKPTVYYIRIVSYSNRVVFYPYCLVQQYILRSTRIIQGYFCHSMFSRREIPNRNILEERKYTVRIVPDHRYDADAIIIFSARVFLFDFCRA